MAYYLQTIMILTQHNGKKLAYYNIPKCGKTTVKSILKDLKNQGGSYKSHTPLFYSPLKDFQSREALRFTVVREPVARFISSYNNRIADRDDFQSSIVSRNLVKPFKLNPSPSLEEFALNIHTYGLLNDRVFRHVINQHRFTGKNIEKFDRIYNLSQINDLVDYMNDLFNIELQAKTLNSSSKQSSKVDLSSEALSRVQEYYEMDYKLFGKYF